jgi:hypothetical protein
VAKKANNNWLIFVDSNIWLDFYRKTGADPVKQLEKLNQHTDRLILTDQVFMEVLKNRQKVILDTIKEMKKPEAPKFPPILQQFKSANTIGDDLSRAASKLKEMDTRIGKVLESPTRDDPVFKALSRIFEADGPYFLKRDAKVRYTVQRLAQKRFFLGFPPRKRDDTSIGDALNWEWIVQCAKSCPNKSNILIVSRDGDYGIVRDKRAFLNDWLRREFRERVAKERKILLTARLTDALKSLDEEVSKEEVAQEGEFIKMAALEAERLSGQSDDPGVFG